MSSGSPEQQDAERGQSLAGPIGPVLASLDEGVVVFDGSGEVVVANDRAAVLLGVDPQTLRDMGAEHACAGTRLEDGTPVEPAGSPVLRALRNGEETRGLRLHLRRADGSEAWLTTACVPVGERDGGGAIWTLSDSTETRRLAGDLAETERRFRDVAENVRAVFWVRSLRTNEVAYVSPAYEEIWGRPPDELYRNPRSWADAIHPDDRAGVLESALASDASGGYEAEYRVIRPDGTTRWIHDRAFALREAVEPAEVVTGMAEDVTSIRLARARQDAVAELSRSALEGATVEQLMQEAIDAINGALGTVLTGILEYVPDVDGLVPRATGDAPVEVARDVRGPAVASQHLRAALDERRPVVVDDWATETRFEVTDFVRRLRAASTIAVPIQGPDGAWGVLGSHSREQRTFSPDEISFVQAVANVLGAGIQRRVSEEDARYRALHDPLTGLPNRILLLDRLAHALSRARRSDGEVALLFLDLDHFKIINDSLGHEAGDQLLHAFAPRLQDSLRPSDTVARFGGDEFVVLLEDLATPQDAAHLAERILEGLREPFAIGTHELFTSATIGLALAHAGADPEGLIRDADAAMYRAKARGRGRYELFDQAMRERVSERLRIENALRRAIADGGLSLAFQPIVALDDNSIVAAEALLRWRDPELGLVPPDRFIPIAEESGLIVPIGEWVLEEAAGIALGWTDTAGPGTMPPQLSVNLSARQVAHPGFVDQLAGMLERTGLSPQRLSLEITESVLMETSEAPMEAVRALKELGVRLVLDDFGTGYSSLSYLNRLPIDVLKLDRSFIAPLRDRESHTTSAIVSGMITMAEALGMTVVAEGVEDTAQVEKLRALGCDFAQGYLFARPLPPGDLDELLGAGTLPTAPEAARIRAR